MKQLFLTVLALVSMVAMSCSDNPTKPKAKFDLKIAFAQQRSQLSKVSVNDPILISENTTIQLGEIYGNYEFSFIIVNNSSSQLDSVQVTSSNHKFTPTKQYFGVIGAPTEDFYTMPLIKITALHGRSITGNDVDSLITQADNTTELTITGKFNGEPFSVSYTLAVTPKYFNPTFITDPTDSTWLNMVINDESCDITISMYDCVNATPNDYRVVYTKFMAGDTVKHMTMPFLKQNKSLKFSCVANPYTGLPYENIQSVSNFSIESRFSANGCD